MENYPFTELAQEIAAKNWSKEEKSPFFMVSQGFAVSRRLTPALSHFRKTWKFRKINQSIYWVLEGNRSWKIWVLGRRKSLASRILSLPSSSAAEAHIVTENSPSSVLMETLFCCHVCVRWLVMAPAAAADETGIDAPLMAKSCGWPGWTPEWMILAVGETCNWTVKSL